MPFRLAFPLKCSYAPDRNYNICAKYVYTRARAWMCVYMSLMQTLLVRLYTRYVRGEWRAKKITKYNYKGKF